jgi:ferrous iron transport protein A
MASPVAERVDNEVVARAGGWRGAGRPEADSSRSLAELRPGDHSRVTTVVGAGAVRQRLLDVGILPGLELRVVRVAPSGDPIWVNFRGVHVSLRRQEAMAVQVA